LNSNAISGYYRFSSRGFSNQEEADRWVLEWNYNLGNPAFHKDNLRHLSFDSQISLLPRGFSPTPYRRSLHPHPPFPSPITNPNRMWVMGWGDGEGADSET